MERIEDRTACTKSLHCPYLRVSEARLRGLIYFTPYSLACISFTSPPHPRWNLLSGYPLLKQILRSDFWPNGINFK